MNFEKIGIILENKAIQKLMLSKNVNNKRYAPRLVFFQKKKLRKIPMIFDKGN